MLKILENFSSDNPEPTECVVTGSVPQWVGGSLLRTGPGVFRFGTHEAKHLFDGMAVLHRFNVHRGKVTYSNRILDSDTYKRNKAANRFVVSEFGTVGVPDPCKSVFTRYFSYYYDTVTMTDNTCVNMMELGDQVYAMTETPLMNRVDPTTLDRIQQVDWRKYVAVHIATAHPLHEPDGTTYNLGTTLGLQSYYHFIKIPPADKGDPDPLDKAELIGRIPSQWPRMPNYSHSFGMTENYLILVEQPAGFNFTKVVTSRLLGAGLSEAMNFYEGYDVRIHVLNKFTGATVRQEYRSAPFFVFHHVNAYEEDQHVVVDLAAHSNGDVVHGVTLEGLRAGRHVTLTPPTLRRFVLPLNVHKGQTGNLVRLPGCRATATLTAEGHVLCTPDIYSDANLELPRINEKHLGKKYNFAYGITDVSSKDDVDKLTKVDLNTREIRHWCEPGHLPGEPVFLASPGATREDDGVLLSPVISMTEGRPSFLLVLDAHTMEELARAEVPEHIKVPISFHGIFTQQAAPPQQ